MKKTLLELKEIDQLIGKLFTKNPKLREGKFGYVYKRFYSKNINPLMEEIQEKVLDSRIENALVDLSTKELLYDATSGIENKIYKYTKEGMKKLVEDTRKVVKEYDAKEVEIIPFFTTDIPELFDEEKEMLVGCLIKE